MRDPMTGLARDRRHPRCPGATAVMIRLLIMAALMCCAATMVAGPDDPYRGQTGSQARARQIASSDSPFAWRMF